MLLGFSILFMEQHSTKRRGAVRAPGTTAVAWKKGEASRNAFLDLGAGNFGGNLQFGGESEFGGRSKWGMPHHLGELGSKHKTSFLWPLEFQCTWIAQSTQGSFLQMQCKAKSIQFFHHPGVLILPQFCHESSYFGRIRTAHACAIAIPAVF